MIVDDRRVIVSTTLLLRSTIFTSFTVHLDGLGKYQRQIPEGRR